MGREEVVHDHEVDLAPVGHLDAMEAVELGDERVGILLDVLVVLREDLAEEFMFGMMDRLDNVLVVSGEVEEAPAFPRGAEFGEDVFAREGH